MKKMTFIACAAMLTSTVILTGCKKEGQNEPQSKAPEVTTDITISLPSNAVGGPRRMPGTTVQTANGTTDFQGIGNIVLVPFAKKGAIVAGDVRQGSNIELGDINATTDLADVSKAKRYTNVKVPMNTASFLFYGESKATDAEANNFFQRGKLTGVKDANTPAGFTFSLSPILANATDVTTNDKYVKLLAYLNSLLDQVDGATPTPKAWKDYTAGDDATFVLLRDTFQTLGTLTSFGVQRMMNDLYETLVLLNPSTPATTTLKTNLINAIKSDTYVDFTATPVPATDPKIVLKEAYREFPTSLNIPEGAVAIAFDGAASTKHFITSASQNYSADFAVAEVTRYTYPSSLWYYANTQIKTSPNSKQSQLENDEINWDAVLLAYENDNSHVSGTTRSIALKSVINYGVARLDVKIKAAEVLEDNTKPVAVNVTNNEGYELTGVLVGNQKNVGFDFTPESYVPSATEYTIYDKVMTSTIKATTEYSAANSTLVLATESGADKDVYVAIELLNNSGVDFRGANGMIPAGGKFYLVGKLLSDKADVVEAGGSVNPGKRVFYPDYTTTARLTITNLKKAYNTIPDLRTPSLELGLSVDLTWENGKVYDIDL